MKQIIQRLLGRPIAATIRQEHAVPLCNYRDNYYGDQICVPRILRDNMLHRDNALHRDK